MQDCVILGSVATFDGVAPDKAQALKVLEEASEVYNAWQVWDECRDDEAKAECRQSLMEECADVVQATVNLVKACGCDDMRLHLMDCEDRNRKRGRITGSKPYPGACGREGCKRFVFVPIEVRQKISDSWEAIEHDSMMPPIEYCDQVIGQDMTNVHRAAAERMKCEHLMKRCKAMGGAE